MTPKINPEWYKKVDSILGDINADLSELVSTSLDTSYNQEVIQNDTKMNHLKITQMMIVTKTFTVIPKMIMKLIMQMKKVR